MNEIINSLCVVVLCASLFTSFLSLIRTISACKSHEKVKFIAKFEEHQKNDNKEYQNIKIEEILKIQQEIINIIKSADNKGESDDSKDLVIEILEKEKKKLEENYHKHEQIVKNE